MKTNDGWINALFSLVFIAAPALVLFYFFLPTWNPDANYSYWITWIITIIFFIYVGLLSLLLIYFKWLTIESLNFNIPITLVLMLILVTNPLPLWATALFVLTGVFTAIPVNIITTKIKENKIREYKKKYNKK